MQTSCTSHHKSAGVFLPYSSEKLRPGAAAARQHRDLAPGPSSRLPIPSLTRRCLRCTLVSTTLTHVQPVLYNIPSAHLHLDCIARLGQAPDGLLGRDPLLRYSLVPRRRRRHNGFPSPRSLPTGPGTIDRHWGRSAQLMKAKTRHRKSHKWRKRCDSSPIAKGRRAKIHGVRNPKKSKHSGGRGL
jgi:hypothetical protein